MSSIRGAGWGQSKLQGKVHLKGDIPSTSPIRGRFMSTKRCSLTRPSFAWINARFPKVQIFVTVSCHTVTWDAVSVSLVQSEMQRAAGACVMITCQQLGPWSHGSQTSIWWSLSASSPGTGSQWFILMELLKQVDLHRQTAWKGSQALQHPQISAYFSGHVIF